MAKTAVDAPRLNAFSVDPSKVVVIGLDTEDGPEHPLYDERANAPLDEGMIVRMVKKGFTHGAIELRKDGDKLEVLVGRQRVKNAREANRRREEEGLPKFAVRAFVKGVDGADALELLIAENEQRRDDALILKAEKCKRLLELGRSEEQAAEAFGVDEQTIVRWMSFFDLAPEVQQAVRNGKAAFSAALHLAELPREEQVDLLEGLPEGEETSGREIKTAVKRRKDSEAIERPGVRKIKRVLAAHGEDPFLAEDFAKALRWVLGEISDKAVKGLTAAGGE